VILATALLDANVLYPAPIRDVLLQLSVSGLFNAKWSADIHHEWIEALLRNEPRRDRVALERTRDLMDRAVRDCLVTGYRSRIPTLSLPDDGDRHVLAAAIAGGCDVIVTQNLNHFPDVILESFGIRAQHPDAFLRALLDIAPITCCEAVRKVRARLKHPPYSVAEYLEILRRLGLAATVARLESFTELL
jgi:hypothetical protein